MAPIKSPLSEQVQKTVGEALQGTLVDLIDLGLTAKQVHWTVVGPNFRSIHEHLDEVVGTARQYGDLVAERAAALGVLPDGRLTAVHEQSRVPQLSADWIRTDAAIQFLVDVLDPMIGRLRERIEETEDDQVTQDLLVEITGALEKHHWMWQAENAAR